MASSKQSRYNLKVLPPSLVCGLLSLQSQGAAIESERMTASKGEGKGLGKAGEEESGSKMMGISIIYIRESSSSHHHPIAIVTDHHFDIDLLDHNVQRLEAGQ